MRSLSKLAESCKLIAVKFLAVVCILAFILFPFAGIAAFGYVLFHFIAKFW